ncbi:cyclic pyranopterin monophosphate synthase MoaC [Opitutaceae bacterium LMO-CP1]|uniref:cyclic pyranopterin monophosphate synthase n=2 Tax=Synoicihabitans lomoniglobus TaxID=2909285 RepID=A0AAF0CT14_9BACT|nr:cyclic pyranopterin monophosphate synthase MoaC [Opitutaceae bacterium LMO-M01]WED67520.1 cyclic pyranopterin monophosphate synthase MoaC [Opitutaceae bacterium LMO-M01]
MLSHLDDQNRPRMVDVGAKAVTARQARARALVHLPPALAALVADNEIVGKKGPVFQTASLAGTMAVKRTSDLIPLCHPLPIEKCTIELHAGAPAADGSIDVEVLCTVGVTAKTGVEMEALTGATIAALTLYDMGKAVTPDIVIHDIRLVAKTGGKSDYQAPITPA